MAENRRGGSAAEARETQSGASPGIWIENLRVEIHTTEPQEAGNAVLEVLEAVRTGAYDYGAQAVQP
jgi:hypothetical protein